MQKTEHKLISLNGGKDAQVVSLDERSDDDLMLLTRGGRKEAFEALVRRYHKQALTVAYKKVGSPSQARDITQTTFLELYRYVPKYQAQGRFRSLLFRILFNECNKAHRSSGYARRVDEALSHMPETMAELPDDQLLAHERRRELERGLLELSDKLRDVLVLRFTAELSYREISAQLGIPVGTVKSRIAAGVAKMREILEGGD